MVVQLLGGNDGLNTVVPHGLDGYNRGRRALRISSGQIHKITPEIGLHPSMGGMAKLLEKGRLSVIQGVGYPNPDRSHFRSMEIWETGEAGERREGARNGLAGSCARRSGPANPAKTRRGCTSVAARCRWRSGLERRKSLRWRTWKTIDSRSQAPTRRSG